MPQHRQKRFLPMSIRAMSVPFFILLMLASYGVSAQTLYLKEVEQPAREDEDTSEEDATTSIGINASNKPRFGVYANLATSADAHTGRNSALANQRYAFFKAQADFRKLTLRLDSAHILANSPDSNRLLMHTDHGNIDFLWNIEDKPWQLSLGLGLLMTRKSADELLLNFGGPRAKLIAIVHYSDQQQTYGLNFEVFTPFGVSDVSIDDQSYAFNPQTYGRMTVQATRSLNASLAAKALAGLWELPQATLDVPMYRQKISQSTLVFVQLAATWQVNTLIALELKANKGFTEANYENIYFLTGMEVLEESADHLSIGIGTQW